MITFSETYNVCKRLRQLPRHTQAGQALVDAVSDLVKSPEMTGRWEKRLRSMEQGAETVRGFVDDIAMYVTELVALEATKPMAPRQGTSATALRAASQRSRRSRGKLRYNLHPARKSPSA